EGVTDHVIDTVPVVTDGTRYLEFSMERPDSGWPRGDYKLVLYVDGKEEVALPFTVESTSGATSAAPISQVTMALGADDEGQPINPTSTFPAGTTKVYTTLYVAEDVATGTPLRAEWYQMQGESPIFIDSYVFEVEGGYNRYFYYEVLDGWPQDEYAIVISLDGKEQAIVQYSVS
ncbi:MAG: hypothetical protein KAI66_24835, partial [Lentisphaeria bacterium]|nr:hypothetical protein [Lentisphaeria bacterium]